MPFKKQKHIKNSHLEKVHSHPISFSVTELEELLPFLGDQWDFCQWQSQINNGYCSVVLKLQ